MYHIGILLFNTSETKALLPTLQKLAAHSNKYKISIIATGYPALKILPESLHRYCEKPLIIEHYLGQLSDNNMYFNPKYLEDILQKLQSCNLIISGCKAIIQQQILQKLPQHQHKAILFDLFYPLKSIKKLAKFAQTLIFTDYKSFTDAKNKLDESKQIMCTRNDDFDAWLASHHKNLKNKEKICRQHHLKTSDKLIVWLGGYDNFTANDKEHDAFHNFIRAMQPYKDKFKLRIAIHPGLTSFPDYKTAKIIKYYYLDQLHEFGFSTQACKNMICYQATAQLTSIATAAVSRNSTAALQAIYIGTEAKLVHLPGQEFSAGIEQVKTAKRWQELFWRWQELTDAAINYPKELEQLNIPLDINTEQTIWKLINS